MIPRIYPEYFIQTYLLITMIRDRGFDTLYEEKARRPKDKDYDRSRDERLR